MERVDKRAQSKQIVLAAVNSKKLKGSSNSIGKEVRSSRIESYLKHSKSKRKKRNKKQNKKKSRRACDSSSSDSSDNSSDDEESLSSSDSESSPCEDRRKKSNKQSRKKASKKRKDRNGRHYESRKNGPFDSDDDESLIGSPRANLKDPKMYESSPYRVNGTVSSETSDMEEIEVAEVVGEDSD